MEFKNECVCCNKKFEKGMDAKIIHEHTDKPFVGKYAFDKMIEDGQIEKGFGVGLICIECCEKHGIFEVRC